MPRNRNRRRSGSYTDTEGEQTDPEVDFEDYGPPKESVIIFLDVDTFDAQVRGSNEGISPDILKTEPFIVVNEFKVITAVNYPAKECGVTRSRDCTEENAIQLCQEYNEHLNILRIPNHHGKPDNLEPSKASDDIYDSILRSLLLQCETRPLPIIEKASKDEFYVDVSDEVYHRVHRKGMPVPFQDVQILKEMKCLLETPRSTARGNKLSYRTQKVITDPNIAQARHSTEALLMHGAAIARIILEDIKNDISFTLSAGVASNKLLAKIGCGLYKPDAITILPHAALPRVSKKVKIESIGKLGGKTGKKIKDTFGIETMFQLGKVDRKKLQQVLKIGEAALEYHYLAVGQDNKIVVAKKFNETLTCGITFSYRTRRMATMEHFHENLWKRFLEMEDHIDYNFNRHGSVMIPQSFRLEVCTRKRNLKFAFKETVNVDDRLKAYIVNKSGHICHSPWKTVHDNFLELMRTSCKIELFAENDDLACQAVRKVSAINLVAVFDRQ